MEWVRVEDRLPEYDTEFLVVNEAGHIRHMRFWALDAKMLLEMFMRERANCGRYTHWMPLPKLP